ncbi:2-amino-4-hydroxy-6-hydroxymethyldihydropteridine diphosphokinase [Actinomyces marmotae]|uniref:Bifunctional folate synthesis protein n=1 Tax=Actinomyces marmotae TaxID=2737173 RepID=A0A6M8B0Z0_9ACTO|nr:2-amino-4-hydroxy-6-hydroxymethyldihydropteridine diphosphokinase [Actinomyces marmotae]QKD80224.1 2-amino-4-hydroxy-6-hydroxymethyldihydropteridine diphosphokinase [Actinomyces marmotae]
MSTVTTSSSDRIRLTGLSARGYHGVLPFERSEGQIFTADITLDLGPRGTAVAAVTDSLNDAVDYSAVANAVVALIEGEPVALLETLAERISETVLAFPRVMAVEVTIHKPNAPLEVAFDDVSVSISRLSEAAASVLSSATSAPVVASAPAVASAPVVASAPSAAPYAAAAGASAPPLPTGLPLPSAPSVSSAPAGAHAAEPANDAPPFPGAFTGRLDAAGDSWPGALEAPLAQDFSAPGLSADSAGHAEAPDAPRGESGQAGPLQAGPADQPWAAAPVNHAEPVGGALGEDSHETWTEGVGFEGATTHDAGAMTLIDDAAPHAAPAPLGMDAHARPDDDRLDSPAHAAGAEGADYPIGAGSSTAPHYHAVEPGHAAVADAVPLPVEPVVDPLAEAPATPVPVVIALGGNLGEVVPSLRRAVRTLQGAEGVEVTAIAPLARTAAVTEPGAAEQPDYLNTVVLARTSLPAKDILALCQRLEADAGRVRLEPKGPRTLDADVITYSDLRSDDPELTLPHPRAASRSFVLLPWSQADAFAEIDGQSVAALAEQAPDRDGIRWLALDWVDSDALPKLPTGQYVPADTPAGSSQGAGSGERAPRSQGVPDLLSAPSAAPVGDEEEPFSETVPAAMVKEALAQGPSIADAAPLGPGMPGAPSVPVPPAPPAPSPFVDQAPQIAEPISGAVPGRPGQPGRAPQGGSGVEGSQRSDDHTWSASSGWEDVLGQGRQGS